MTTIDEIRERCDTFYIGDAERDLRVLLAALDAEKLRADGADDRIEAIARAERAEAEACDLRAQLTREEYRRFKEQQERDAAIARAERAEAERDEATRKLDLSLRAWEARNSVELVGDEAYAWADLMESDDAARLLAETRRERDAAIAARAESEAALSLLREQWDAMEVERRDAVQAWKEANGYDDLIDAYGAVVEERNELRAEAERLASFRARIASTLGVVYGDADCTLELDAIERLTKERDGHREYASAVAQDIAEMRRTHAPRIETSLRIASLESRLATLRAAAERVVAGVQSPGDVAGIDYADVVNLRAALAQPERVHYAEIEGAEHGEE